MNFKRPNLDSRSQENRLEALKTFKKKCDYIFKRSLLSRFRREENVFWYKIGSVLKAKRSMDDVLRLQTDVRDEVERVVSPECNENIASKRNLKNGCKKPGETTPAETAIMYTKIRQVPRKDDLLTVYLINSRKNDS